MENQWLAYLAQANYFCLLIAFAMPQVLFLRFFAMASSAAAIAFGFLASEEPLWIPILWNILFFTANAAYLVVALLRKRAVKLNGVEDFLAKTVLQNFPPAEVRSFAKLARTEVFPAEKKIIELGTTIDNLYCILHGSVQIQLQSKRIAELKAGRFLGEMSLLTKSKARADVLTATELTVLIWPHEAIEAWVGEDRLRLSILQSAMGTQVVEELLRQQKDKITISSKGLAA